MTPPPPPPSTFWATLMTAVVQGGVGGDEQHAAATTRVRIAALELMSATASVHLGAIWLLQLHQSRKSSREQQHDVVRTDNNKGQYDKPTSTDLSRTEDEVNHACDAACGHDDAHDAAVECGAECAISGCARDVDDGEGRGRTEGAAVRALLNLKSSRNSISGSATATITASAAAAASCSCSCLLCVTATAAQRCDPWVTALPTEGLAHLAHALGRLLACPAGHYRPSGRDGNCRAAPVPHHPLSGPLAKAGKEGYRPHSCSPGRAAVLRELHVLESGGGMAVWLEVTAGWPLLALLRLYSLARRRHLCTVGEGEKSPGKVAATVVGGRAAVRGGSDAEAEAAEAAEAALLPPCCMAAKELMAAVAEVCRMAPLAVRREIAAAARAADGHLDE
ncbi:hypothetical protein Vafri_8063, partial [Volvox africanus]